MVFTKFPKHELFKKEKVKKSNDKNIKKVAS